MFKFFHRSFSESIYIHVYQPVIVWTVIFTDLSKFDQSEVSIGHLDRKWLYKFVAYCLMTSVVAQI